MTAPDTPAGLTAPDTSAALAAEAEAMARGIEGMCPGEALTIRTPGALAALLRRLAAALRRLAAALADARAQGRREGLEEAARVMNKLTATWPHVGPVPCRVQGEWGLRDKVLPAIRALAQGGKP